MRRPPNEGGAEAETLALAIRWPKAGVRPVARTCLTANWGADRSPGGTGRRITTSVGALRTYER